ncbi:hypothetical protein NLG97_g6103 [Lecanicillium saksenae]|uniref:Uncharacterized protein n=1 Tax=Lecanicillium saksenae TaxID=468837 RepID=A0ACC1QQR0_9HYPO|nr:hypothetical protein NLG97_g6103 [Lecanicillium saksenae]
MRASRVALYKIFGHVIARLKISRRTWVVPWWKTPFPRAFLSTPSLNGPAASSLVHAPGQRVQVVEIRVLARPLHNVHAQGLPARASLLLGGVVEVHLEHVALGELLVVVAAQVLDADARHLGELLVVVDLGDELVAELEGDLFVALGADNSFVLSTLPEAKELISSVAFQSGGGQDVTSYDVAQKSGAAYAEYLKCSTTDLECLQNLSVKQLQDAFQETPYLQGTPTDQLLAPYNAARPNMPDIAASSIDNDLIKQQPLLVGPQLPFISGYTRNDSNLFVVPEFYRYQLEGGKVTESNYTNFLLAWGEEPARLLNQTYPLSKYLSQHDNITSVAVVAGVADMVTAANFKCPSYKMHRAGHAAGVRSYAYQFDKQPSCPWIYEEGIGAVPPVGFGSYYGAAHCADIPFAFGNMDAQPFGVGNCSASAAERGMSKTMVAAWTEMATNTSPSTPRLRWPRFGRELEGVFFDDEVAVAGIDFEECTVWDEVFGMLGGVIPPAIEQHTCSTFKRRDQDSTQIDNAQRTPSLIEACAFVCFPLEWTAPRLPPDPPLSRSCFTPTLFFHTDPRFFTTAMETDCATLAAVPAPAVEASKEQIECSNPSQPNFLHSPPDSNNAAKTDASDSELSELDDEPALDGAPPGLSTSAEPPATEDDQDDIGEVLPDHWSGTVPVFKPTMDQFKDFKKFMKKVDSYGMTSGIIKVIPPEEWKAAQPKLDELVKQIRVREPIKQDIMGSNGTYRQVNILHGRSYNLPQWRQLCDQSEHQPPARRGERRANADKPKPPRAKPSAPRQPKTSTPKKRGRGRGQ